MTTNDQPSILIYGYGNPGREDDGLGIAFIDALDKQSLPHCTLEQNYQLNAEDALLISEFPVVLFVDASLTPEHFSLSRIKPAYEIGFTTHAMEPSSVVALCNQLYHLNPSCYLLEIKGYSWEMKEGLSENAVKNLENAIEVISPVIQIQDPVPRLELLSNQ